MVSWQRTAMAAKTSRCNCTSRRKCWNKIPQSLNLLLIVSCQDLNQFIICFLSSGTVQQPGHFTFRGASPMYPSSASTRSNSSNCIINAFRKIVRSLSLPGMCGLLIQKISPPKIERATSYLSPDRLNLWE